MIITFSNTILIVCFILIWIKQVCILFHIEIIGIRLANDAELKGRLELLVRNQSGVQQWLAVCALGNENDDIRWNHQAAWVACRQLGYHGGMARFFFSVANRYQVNDIRCGDGKILYK